MRSRCQVTKYSAHIAGILKDISFHELFMNKLRKQLASDQLFQISMAFEMVDIMRMGSITGSNLQGFLHKNQLQFPVDVCNCVINALSNGEIRETQFEDLLIPIDMRMEVRRHHDMTPVSIHDYDYWRRVKANTQQKICRIFQKQAVFYTELRKRQQMFCQLYFGDIYSFLNEFGHQSNINYEMMHQLMKGYGKLFNIDEYRALLRRAKASDDIITKQQIVELIVTNKIGFKEEKAAKPKEDYREMWSYRRKQTEKPKQNYNLDRTLITQHNLSYRFHYPEAQMTSVGSFYLLGQRFLELNSQPY